MMISPISTIFLAIFAVALTAGAESHPPKSVTKYDASIAKLRELGHPSPVYTATCSGTATGELVAFGCLDICAMLDAYQGPGYQFPDKEMIGGPAHRYVHPNWEVPLYFKRHDTFARCVPMLESGTLTVAYGGWCTAGVEDLEVHFSSPNKAPYRVEHYGDKTVIYITNMAKTEVVSTPELQAHVADWLEALEEGESFDLRGLYVPVLLDDFTGYQPPKEGVHWNGIQQ